MGGNNNGNNRKEIVENGSRTEQSMEFEGRRQEHTQGEVGRVRKRLIFPQSCPMTFLEKLKWAVQLGREHRSFEPLLKEGTHKPYLTVGTMEAVEMLTTVGYKGLPMVLPEESDILLTKVIIFRYPVILDPEYLLDD